MQGVRKFSTELKNPCPYYLGCNSSEQFIEVLKEYEFDRIYFVTNGVLAELYGGHFKSLFQKNNIEYSFFEIKDTEEDKNFTTLEGLCEKLVQSNITKASIIIAFGGGCLGNIVGLASAMIFRGIRYIEIPTTLMSITDSTLSNKQAVNGREGKNLFGVYYTPIFIWGDVQSLKSEKIKNIKAALVEGIKNAFISDKSLLSFYEEILIQDKENYTVEELHKIAIRMIESKLPILKKDPSERDYAVILEYGHTYGHAMEWLTGGKIIHGLAVAKGMCIAAELSYKLGFITKEEKDLHYHVLRDLLKLDVTIPDDISVDDILSAIASDNKKNQKGITYILLKTVGECLNQDNSYDIYVDENTVRQVLEAYKEKK